MDQPQTTAIELHSSKNLAAVEDEFTVTNPLRTQSSDDLTAQNDDHAATPSRILRASSSSSSRASTLKRHNASPTMSTRPKHLICADVLSAFLLILITFFFLATIALHCFPVVEIILGGGSGATGRDDWVRVGWLDITVPLQVLVGIICAMGLVNSIKTIFMLTCCHAVFIKHYVREFRRRYMSEAGQKDRLDSMQSSPNSKLRVRDAVRSAMKWVRGWHRWWVFALSPKHPLFLRIEFAREVQEFLSQCFQLKLFSENAVPREMMCIYTAIILLNSGGVLILFIADHKKITSVRSAGTRTRWVLLLDALCDTLYGIWPLIYGVYVIFSLLLNEADDHIICDIRNKTYPHGAMERRSDCVDTKAVMALGVGQATFFGGTSFAEVFLKMWSRLLPLYFATARISEAFESEQVYRILHEQQRSRSKTKLVVAAVKKEQGPPETAEAGSNNKETRGSMKKKASAVDILRSTKKKASRLFASRTSSSSAGGNFYHPVPRRLAAALIATVACFCGFVWFRLGLIQTCPVPELREMHEGGMCASRIWDLFNLDVNEACGCHVILGFPKNGCRNASSVDSLLKNFIKHPSRIRGAKMINMNNCELTGELLEGVLQFGNPEKLSIIFFSGQDPVDNRVRQTQEVDEQYREWHSGTYDTSEELDEAFFHRWKNEGSQVTDEISLANLNRLTNLKYASFKAVPIGRAPPFMGTTLQKLVVLRVLPMPILSRGGGSPLNPQQVWELPNDLASIPVLRSIKFDGRYGVRLKQIPAAMPASITDLQFRRAGLDDSQVGSTPRFLPNLNYLDLSNNSLTHPPTWLGDCHKLTKLDLYSNNMASLGAGAFRKLTNLEVASLAANRLSSISRDAVAGLAKLTRLELCHNHDLKDADLDPMLFKGLDKLQLLSISKTNMNNATAVCKSAARVAVALERCWDSNYTNLLNRSDKSRDILKQGGDRSMYVNVFAEECRWY